MHQPAHVRLLEPRAMNATPGQASTGGRCRPAQAARRSPRPRGAHPKKGGRPRSCPCRRTSTTAGCLIWPQARASGRSATAPPCSWPGRAAGIDGEVAIGELVARRHTIPCRQRPGGAAACTCRRSGRGVHAVTTPAANAPAAPRVGEAAGAVNVAARLPTWTAPRRSRATAIGAPAAVRTLRATASCCCCCWRYAPRAWSADGELLHSCWGEPARAFSSWSPCRSGATGRGPQVVCSPGARLGSSSPRAAGGA